MDIKRCGMCREEKSLDDFHNNRNNRDGRTSRCKECAKAVARKWTEDNRQRARDGKREYARSNPDVISDQYYRKTYGITLDQYKSLGTSCGICGGLNRSGRALAVDHDHSCCSGVKSCGECVRGVLCMDCNTGLGKFKDDPELLRAAIAYLKSQRQ